MYKPNIQLFAEANNKATETIEPTTAINAGGDSPAGNIGNNTADTNTNPKESASEQDKSTTTQNADATKASTQEPESKQEPLDTQALGEIENALKDMSPGEVVQFQRELSKALKLDLFADKGAKALFDKYDPSVQARAEKAKAVVDKITADKKDAGDATAQPQATDTANELLRTKVELELLKSGCPQNWLDDAVVIAMNKVKDVKDLTAVKAIASKYAGINASGGQPNQPPMPTRTSAGIGDKGAEMTQSERDIAFLRKNNPEWF